MLARRRAGAVLQVRDDEGGLTMPRWTVEELRDYENRRASQNPKPQPAPRYEPVAEERRAQQNTGRFLVSIRSFRTRLLDPDNLVGGCKYFLDCCRYAGLIPGDEPDKVTLSVSQEKVSSSGEERTEIEIIEIQGDAGQ